MKSKSNSKSWIITLGVAGTAVAYVWWVFLPGQKAIAALRHDLQSKRTFAINLPRYTSGASESKREKEQTQQYVDRWSQTLVVPADIPRLYAEIAAVAKEAGVETTRFSPDPPVRYARLTKFPVNLACEGSFQQMTSLVEGLEKLSARIWFENVTFEAIGEGEGLLRCEISLEVFAKNSGFSG